MKALIAAAVVVSGIALTPISAAAGERVNDAVMGGVAGALVGGPIGLVAGGLIGYNAGPAIASGMGVRHRDYRDYPRRTYVQRDTSRHTGNW
jgi:hypothetical protein